MDVMEEKYGDEDDCTRVVVVLAARKEEEAEPHGGTLHQEPG